MATHRRNWNSELENFAADLLYDNDEFFTDKAKEVYEELTAHANFEIEMLNKMIQDLEDMNERLADELEDAKSEVEKLESLLNEID